MSDSGCIPASSRSGSPGPPGADGDDGQDGPAGPPGIAGATGATGPAGTTGAQGPPGLDGADGEDGNDGPQGARGPTGATGADGARGPTGVQGSQGPPGNDGDDGNDGPPGPPGTAAPTDGWLPAQDVWVYVSNTTGAGNGAIVFKVVGSDATDYLFAGVRVSWDDGTNTPGYGVVETATFSTDTTVTLIRQNVYTAANTTWKRCRYSLASVQAGFPKLWTYLPTITGYSSLPTTTAYVWNHIGGNMIEVSFAEGANGTSNATTMTYTLPATATATSPNTGQWQFSAATTDSLTGNTPSANLARVLASTNVMNVFDDYAGGAWPNAGIKRLRSTAIIYPFG